MITHTNCPASFEFKYQCKDRAGNEVNSDPIPVTQIDCYLIDTVTATEFGKSPFAIDLEPYTNKTSFKLLPNEVLTTDESCVSRSFDPIVSCDAISIGLNSSCVSIARPTSIIPLTIDVLDCPQMSQFKIAC